jgi:predicted ATPase
MGNSAEFDLLEMVSEHSNEEMHRRLWDAVRAGLILRTEQSYAFLHDRVQEAAYSLIPENARAETHLRIGNLLAARISPERQEETVFEIVNQLNRGSDLITSAEERKRLAALNLMAGKRAKSSTAYASALSYLRAARALLTERSWDEDYELIFSVECDTAECEFLTADMVPAENRLLMLAQRDKGTHDIAAVTRLRMALYTTLALTDRAAEVGVEQLRTFGIEWSTQLDLWAQNCPETFENRAALVAAEIARIEGRELDAMRLYEQAIRTAHYNGFVQNEALANELAARFYAARGLETSSHAHLRNARQGYLRWGADGKVRQLDQLHPRLRQDERA